MTKEKLKTAKEEARRFLDRVEKLEKTEGGLDRAYFYAPKQSGAVRRASMDLTRALAELRKY